MIVRLYTATIVEGTRAQMNLRYVAAFELGDDEKPPPQVKRGDQVFDLTRSGDDERCEDFCYIHTLRQ